MKFDLHVHSCLSPCASLEMSPAEIARRARLAGLGGIALTDHQTARNAPAFFECARREGIACLAGLEVCTAEEAHVLTLFDTPEQAMEMTEAVYAAMPKRVNDPDVFGDQPVVTADGEILDMEWRILAAACRLSVQAVAEKCRSLGGVCVAAHIDRPAFSVCSQLGAVPEGVFDAVELSRTADADAWLPRAGGLAAVRGSDAHNSDDIALVWSEAPLEEFSIAALGKAFAERNVALSPRLTPQALLAAAKAAAT